MQVRRKRRRHVSDAALPYLPVLVVLGRGGQFPVEVPSAECCFLIPFPGDQLMRMTRVTFAETVCSPAAMGTGAPSARADIIMSLA